MSRYSIKQHPLITIDQMKNPAVLRSKKTVLIVTAIVLTAFAAAFAIAYYFVYRGDEKMPVVFTSVRTLAGKNREFGEPFGIAVKGGEVYVSDGDNDKIWKVTPGGAVTMFAQGLDTPSGLAFTKSGDLIVADSGSHTIKKIDASGRISILAGIDGKAGSNDGESASAQFFAPIGVAVAEDGKIYVADTYNDRIRLIENGRVTTIAGKEKGFAEGTSAKFDTPCGIAIWKEGRVLVADTGNRRVRVIEPGGSTWTLAGSGEDEPKDGLLPNAAFSSPVALALSAHGEIYIADDNAIRMIGLRTIPVVETLSNMDGGLADGSPPRARLNHPTGLAIDASGDLLAADSENQLVRIFSARSAGAEITPEEKLKLRYSPKEFREMQPARWPYDPADRPRDIAGTLGELRGEVTGGDDFLHFHNGLDIAGGYGEIARFVRDEKVLRPIAAENFETLREWIRMPTMGYIHVRVGRAQTGEAFKDPRFHFFKDAAGKTAGVRVPRGTKFKAGEPLGTLNPMNHVHLIAGRSGAEMNAIDALFLPGASDSKTPIIDKLTLFDENWREIETPAASGRIKLSGKTRIVTRAYDQMDGNNERRRLGVYKAGYQVIKQDGSALGDVKWTISFERLPVFEAAKFTFARGSHSGATGETIFNYIVSNTVSGDTYNEDFFDAGKLEQGIYILRVHISDYFGNTATKDINFEV